MKVSIKNSEWKDCGFADLNDCVFNGCVRKDLIARAIRWQQAKSRGGNASTKTLSMVQGTTRKPWNQKETGKSRQGSLRAPHFRGGAVVFGPHPRSYEHSLNKKVRVLAQVAALSDKCQDGLFHIMENFAFEFKKTSECVHWLNDKNLKSVLFVVEDAANVEVFKYFRNIPYCDVIPVIGLNVLDVVKHKNIICNLQSLNSIESRFLNSSTVKEGLCTKNFLKKSEVKLDGLKNSIEKYLEKSENKSENKQLKEDKISDEAPKIPKAPKAPKISNTKKPVSKKLKSSNKIEGVRDAE